MHFTKSVTNKETSNQTSNKPLFLPSPHASSETTIPSTSGLQEATDMRRNEEDHKKNEGSISDWISGGPVGSKGAVLVFRSCVLASRTPSMESQTKNASANTGTTILLNKAKSMARRLVAEPHSFSVRPKNIMHEVMETFGSGRNYQGQSETEEHLHEVMETFGSGRNYQGQVGSPESLRKLASLWEPHSFSVRPKNIMHEVMETFGSGRNYQRQAYVVRHVSDANVPETEPIDMEEQGHEAAEHKRDIDDVLNDLNKITLKKHLNIENTTANIKPEDPTPSSTKGNFPFTISRNNFSLQTFGTRVKIAAEQKMDFDNLNKIILKKHLNIENTTANIKPEDPTPSSTKGNFPFTISRNNFSLQTFGTRVKIAAEHKMDFDDLNKITLKKHLNIENTTANIKPEDPTPSSTKNSEPQKKKKGKVKRKIKNAPPVSRTEPLDSDDSEHLLVKEVESVKVLESHAMPARTLKITYKLVNTETKLLHRLLQAHGLQEAAPESKDFNLLWSGLHPKPDVLRNLSPYQRVNHFPRSYELTRKDKLFKNIEKMQYFRGLKHFDFVPTTFLMPAEFKELCSTHFRTKGPWIVKPAASSRGRGIYIVNTPDQIPKGENVVVAKYIDKPLLIGGHKCDLRLYVCVTSIDPLLIYLYEEGLVRFATVKYDKTNKNLWNPCMHLCNYSINKYHTDYIKCDDPNAGNVGHKWTLSALLRYLRKQGRNTTSLMAAIEDLVVKSVLSSAQTITAASRVFVPNFFNCFELFGYDILIDDMLKPWLLEINLSPSLACESPLDARVKSALLADTLTLVGLPAVPMCKAEIPGQNNSLKMRIGACRRVHSAENVFVRGGKVSSPTTQHSNSGTGVLTGEELRLVRAVRAQYARRGGYVRIFPSQNSWQKYSQYLDPVTGIPVCSTSLNNNVPYTVVSHNYNLLVHSHVLPHFQHATVATNVATNDTPQRLKRYENVTITSTAPAISLGSDPTNHHDTRRAKELVKRQLQEGSRLTMGESRRAFGLFLTHVLKRVSNPGNELAVAHAVLALKFLKRASATLRMPYNVKGPPAKMCDKDRCAIIAKQLNDFLYMYYRETDLYTDSEDRDGCVSNIQFAQFLYSASEADLEDVLLLQLKTENNIVTFIGEPRNPYCVDLPPSKLIPEPNTKHTLLKYLANLAPVNTRRFRQSDSSRETSDSLPGSEALTYTHSDLLVKDSLKEEKPLNQALKYARS
ncbi:hypothetical protein O0L34_g13016 [Tuta absoluta]|nr:hypothetical protein O0L34_g13016 [Tuta absoluta]